MNRLPAIGLALALALILLGCRAAQGAPPALSAPTLLVTGSAGSDVLFVDPLTNALERVEVGASPWGIALDGGRAFVSTAEGVAVIELAARRRIALVPFQAQAQIGAPGRGEYRLGGMGIAAADGRVYVAVHLPGGESQLEVLDTGTLSWLGAVPVGRRPFDVLVAADGREAYSIDHDGYSVTIVDARTLAARRVVVAPLGRGAFDKPHHAVLTPLGRLLLPVQGRVLAELDPATGQLALHPLSAATHQHGVALTSTGQLLIVGTGPAGNVSGGPSLTRLELANGKETVLSLARAHERIAADPAGGVAYLTGGYLLGGWDGITVVDLFDGSSRELSVPDRPLDIALVPGRPAR